MCLSDGARLYIRSPLQTQEDLIELNAGDVIVMRGDTLHAGGESVLGHFARIHCYMDSMYVRHKFDSTDRADGEPDKNCIPTEMRTNSDKQRKGSRPKR